MPTPGARFALIIGALAATLILGGAGTGIAMADPDDPGNNTDTETSTDAGNVPETEPTVIPAPVPRSLPEQLRDMLHRPLSIFGNGRVPGASATTEVPKPPETKPSSKKSDPPPDGVVPRKPVVPKPEPTAPEPVAPKTPVWTPSAAADIKLPFTPAFTVPLPTLPGTEGLRLSIDLTDPYTTYSTVQQTLNTVNSLIADAYAPYNPFPPPKPEPSFRITAEEPVIDADGLDAHSVAAGPDGGNLPVLQAPMVPPPRVGSPRGFPEPIRGGGARPEVIGGGSAGVQTPGIRGSVTPNSPVQAGEVIPGGAFPPVGRPAPRQGYPQYLRTAGVGELTAVALPGVLGLVALTASGSVVGYRQANSGRHLREDSMRFLR